MSSCTVLWCIPSPGIKDLTISLRKYDILRVATAVLKAVTVKEDAQPITHKWTLSNNDHAEKIN